MEDLIRSLLDWVGANPGWSYLAVLLGSFAESLAMIGLVVPGVMIMLGAGALIATGELQFWPTCLSAIAGAVAGDGLSFWVGRRYRKHIRGYWPFRRHPQHLDQGIAFFERYGAKSVVIGRFFGPVRAVIPLVAGMMQMPPRRFVSANVASALAWAPAYLAPGIVFGASLKLAAEAAARLAILLVILAGVVWLCVWVANRLFWLLSPHANSWLRALLRWADVHPRVGPIAQALADPHHPDARTLAGLAMALLVATAMLGVIVSVGLFGAQGVAANEFTLDLGQSLHAPWANTLMAVLGRLGAPVVIGTLGLCVFGYLRWLGHRRDANYWLAACAFALIATPALGWLLRVHRPPLGLELAWPWSFPSVPVLSATLAYGFLAVMLSRGMQGRRRSFPYSIAAVAVASVALARLYFGAEWLTDVAGSFALGLAWVSTLGLAFRRHTADSARWTGLAFVVLISTSASLTWSSLGHHASDLARYTPHPPKREISVKAWRQRTCDLLPKRREDLWQHNRRPFDLAYAGELADLTAAMQPQAWQRADMLSWGNAIKLLSPSLPLAQLPVIPHVHDGHHERLTLVKDVAGDRRLVLRLWATPCRIEDNTPVWIGDVTALHKENIVSLIALPLTRLDHGAALRTFFADLTSTPTLVVDSGDPDLVATRQSGLLTP